MHEHKVLFILSNDIETYPYKGTDIRSEWNLGKRSMPCEMQSNVWIFMITNTR